MLRKQLAEKTTTSCSRVEVPEGFQLVTKPIMSESKLPGVKGKSKGIWGVGGVAPSLPPPLQVVPGISQKFRFKAVSNFAGAITVADLIGVMGVMAATTTSAYSIVSSIRVKSVTVFPPSESGVSTCFLAWLAGSSGQVKDEALDGSIPGGITSTRSLCFKPPAKTLAADWIESSKGTSDVFSLDVPSGSIIDVLLDGKFSFEFPSEEYTVSGATVGQLYYMGLDGVGAQVPPTTLTTIT
jgi:hypothetical protein